MEKKIDSKISNMIRTLAVRLTKKEFFILYELMDGDPPAGPFYCAVADKAVEMFPKKFADVRSFDALKKTVDNTK